MIKLVIFDLDGCFTDGSLHQHILNAKDTYSLKKLISLNIKTAIISKTQDKITDKFLTERISYIYTNVNNKIETCDHLLNELNLKYDEVAYIGDDEPDIDLLKKVKISACPNDSIIKVKNIVDFISSKDGGKGAVREFVDFVIDYNNRINKKIVPVIGVRSGSLRCKNKNTRDFGLNQNLLEKKLKILSDIDYFDKIIVSSDSNEYLDIAKKYKKVKIDKRPDYYASSNISGKELHLYLCSLLDDDEVFMYTHVVSPFLEKNDYLEVLKKWRMPILNDSICLSIDFKEFLWLDNKSINYDLNNMPKSQDLPDYFIPTFGISLIEKEKLIDNKSFIGKNPLFIKVDKLKGIDIDDNFDFAVAKLLNENNINDMNSLELYLDKSEINLLDCSIRDGGYRNNWNFSDSEVSKMYSSISDSGIEYFEIGFRSTKLENGGKWLYSSDNDIKNIKNSYNGKTPAKLAVMIKYSEYDLSDITENSPVDMYRVLIKSKDYNNEHNRFIVDTIKRINQLGKEVGLNIPCGHKLDKDLKTLFIELKKNNCKVDIFYLADTFGSMDELQIVNSFNELEEMLKGYVDNPIFGFHAHDNNSDALSKSLYAIEKSHRIKYIDSCILGMGRGIGNLKTEDVISKLNKNMSKNYNLNKIYELIFNEYPENKSNILYKLSADYLVHPNYVNDILEKELDFEKSLELIKELSSYKSNSYKKL
jgi:YrbI family 3-deoxy-D-manno-octulosonate 8-phosphate phosphatase